MPTISIEDFIAQFPEEFKPLARQMFPYLAQHAADELHAIFNMLLNGDTDAAISRTFGSMTLDQLIADSLVFTATDTQHADENAAHVEQMKKFATEAVKLAIAIFIGMIA